MRFLALWACVAPLLPLSAYVCPAAPPEALRDPVEGDFDYDLFRKDQRAIDLATEFLFWKVDEGGLDYALKMKHPAWGNTPSYAQGNYEKTKFDWNPGFRVSVAFFNAPKYWKVIGQYTWIHSHGHNDASAPSGADTYLTGTWPQIFSSPLNRAKTDIATHYSLGDWLVARVFHPNPHMRLKLIGGLSAPWIHQQWEIRYFGEDESQTYIKNSWRFSGAGPRVGIGVDWYWFTDIYVTAKSTFASIIGSYKNDAFQQTSANPSGSDDPHVPVRDAHYKDMRSAFTFNFAVGPSWQKAFTCTRIELFVGYEITQWFNLQEVYRSTASAPSEAKETWVNSSTMSLQGVTTRLSIYF